MSLGIYGAYNTRDTGPSRVTEGLAAALSKSGLDVTVYVHGDRREPPCEGVDLTYLGPSPSGVRGYLDVQRRARAEMADHEVTHALGGFYGSCTVDTVQWTSGEYERWRRCPRDFGGYRALTGDVLLSAASRVGAMRSETVVASSPETARQMRDHWRLDPDHIVPLGIDPTNEPEAYDVSTPPKVLVPGRVTQKKGQKRVLNRLDPGLDLQVDVVGSIADEAYRDSISGDWTFHGFVDRSTLDRFFGETDVVVVPSYHENFSMTALEAVASGCALVITDSCGFAQFEDVRRSDGVAVVADGSEAAEAVRDFATGSGLAQRKRAAHELSKHYRWSRIADRYCDFYQRVG